MAFEHKEGRGTMFKNTRKTSDKHPEYRGDFKGLDGVVYDIAFWWAKDQDGNLKKDRDGNPMMSLKIEHKRDEQKEAPKAAADELSDQVPF